MAKLVRRSVLVMDDTWKVIEQAAFTKGAGKARFAGTLLERDVSILEDKDDAHTPINTRMRNAIRKYLGEVGCGRPREQIFAFLDATFGCSNRKWKDIEHEMKMDPRFELTANKKIWRVVQ